VTALDLSEDALSLAKENAATNRVEIDFVRSDLLASLPDDPGADGNVLFVANLPYIREGATDMSPDTVFEPAMALYGGNATGFELTAEFLRQIEGFHVRHTNLGIAVACEVGDDHEDEIRAIARELGRDIRTFPDLTGTHRFFTYRIWPS
jgi:release factor glutamine methyltransferase